MTPLPVAVSIVPLVSNLALPRPASAQTRSPVPAGFGVQEHCLPFTAASAVGFLIPSPIRFGWCYPDEAPPGCHQFRSPLNRRGPDGRLIDARVFYVVDDPSCGFQRNAFELQRVVGTGNQPLRLREPGLSFFDRDDQLDLFKLHLPYVWRTPELVDTLFGPLVNRSVHGLEAQSGLVETDWYASPVNLVFRQPPASVHVERGDVVSQAILIPRQLRRPALDIAPEHSRVSREARKALARWEEQHAADHNAYKTLARSRHGRIDD
jgi:hypothetical protein